MSPPLPAVKARYLVFWLVLSSLLGGLVVARLGHRAGLSPQLSDAVFVWVMYPALVLFTLLHARLIGLSPRDMVGAPLDRSGMSRTARLAIPLIGFSLVSLYIVFAPLSLVMPAGVHWWLFEDVPVMYDPGPPFRPFANLASLTALTIAAPVAEEWLFRGLLLRRWADKWGFMSGTVGSSLLFAALHPDVVGAFAFGVVACLTYHHYRSLWAPIVLHAAYNGLVMLLIVVSEHTAFLSSPATVEQLRSAWWMPVVGTILLAPWLTQAVRASSRTTPSR